MIVTPDDGALELWGDTFRSALVVDVPLSVRLYVNNYTPDRASVLGSFVEPSGFWYFRETINRATWPAPAIVGGKASGTYPTVFEWMNTDPAAVTLYGYFIVNGATGKVRWCERFATPRVLDPGAKFQLQCVTTGTYQT